MKDVATPTIKYFLFLYFLAAMTSREPPANSDLSTAEASAGIGCIFLRGHTGEVFCVASSDGLSNRWSCDLDEEEAGGACSSFANRGLLLSGGEDGSLRLWDLRAAGSGGNSNGSSGGGSSSSSSGGGHGGTGVGKGEGITGSVHRAVAAVAPKSFDGEAVTGVTFADGYSAFCCTESWSYELDLRLLGGGGSLVPAVLRDECVVRRWRGKADEETNFVVALGGAGDLRAVSCDDSGEVCALSSAVGGGTYDLGGAASAAARAAAVGTAAGTGIATSTSSTLPRPSDCLALRLCYSLIITWGCAAR